MKLPAVLRCFIFLAAFAIAMPRALAWDSMGHMIVDEIAYENVKPEVRAKVAALLPLIEAKYNDHKPYNFITAGCYMDDARASKSYQYGPWHYVDINYTPDARAYAEPAPPNVIWAIEQSANTLKAPAASDAQKAEALAMLMHFVADIHQPLHCADWNDKGGTGYFIAGVPMSDQSKKQPANLHAFWDRAFRYDVKKDKVVELYYSLWPTERPGVPADGIIADQAAKLMKEYPRTRLAGLVESDDPHAWARESYRYACRFGYPRGPHPQDYEVVTLSHDFVSQAHEIACRRVVTAGYRLADLLTQIFGEN
jgi:hypothetical protein